MHLPSDPVPDEKYWHKDIKMYVSNTQVTNFFSYKRYVHFWQFHKQSFIFAGYLHRFSFGPLSQKCVALLKTTSRFWKIEIISLQLEFLDRPQIRIADTDLKLLYFETAIMRISALVILPKWTRKTVEPWEWRMNETVSVNLKLVF